MAVSRRVFLGGALVAGAVVGWPPPRATAIPGDPGFGALARAIDGTVITLVDAR